MVSYPVQVGRAAVSLAGRDTGRVFVITQIVDTHYVYISDGNLRKIDHPKKKKLKHLKLSEQVLESIAGKLTDNIKVFDAEIRSAIRSLQSSSDA